MAINISTVDFYESLIDFLGFKSGLALDRADIIELLKQDEHLSEYADLHEDGGIRIHSEEFEEITEYLLYRVGRLEQRWNAPPGIALFHKYKNDPRMSAIVQDVGEEFTTYLEKVVADPNTRS